MKFLHAVLLSFITSISLHTNAGSLCNQPEFSEQFRVLCSSIGGEFGDESIQLIKRAHIPDLSVDGESTQGLGAFTFFLNQQLQKALNQRVKALVSFNGKVSKEYIPIELATIIKHFHIGDLSTVFVIEAPLSTLLHLSTDPKLKVMAPDAPLSPTPAVTVKN